MDTDVARVPSVCREDKWSAQGAHVVVVLLFVFGSLTTHARYATVREGSLLKCSDSMKRSSKFQLMEAGAQDGGCCGVGRLAWVGVCAGVSAASRRLHYGDGDDVPPLTQVKASWPFRA